MQPWQYRTMVQDMAKTEGPLEITQAPCLVREIGAASRVRGQGRPEGRAADETGQKWPENANQ